MVKYCAVYGCLVNKKRNANRRFFQLPKNEKRCRQWIRAIGRADLVNKAVNILHRSYYICDLHFLESDIHGKYLKCNASPALLLPNGETLPQSSHLADLWDLSKSVQTDIPIELPVPVFSKSIQTDTELSCKSCKLQMTVQDCWQFPSTWKEFQSQTSNTLSVNTPQNTKLKSEDKNKDLSSDEDSTPLAVATRKKRRESAVNQDVETEGRSVTNSAQKHELCESYGRYVGQQIKDINEHQLAICQKIISDTIFSAKLNKLNEYSHVVTPPEPPNLEQNQFYSMPSSTSFNPRLSHLVDVRSRRSQQSAAVTSSAADESIKASQSPEGNSTDDDPLLVIKSETEFT